MATQKTPDRGPDHSPSGPREANDPGSTRYGTNAGSGANQPKRNERKDSAGFVSRQGGDQTNESEQDPGTGPRPNKTERDG